jgi:chorismate mutase/prephenate dehydratase
MDDTLKPLRERIDALDAQLLDLLNQRAAVAQQVGELKKAADAPVFRPEREAQVLRGLIERNAGPLPNSAVESVFREIMSACRALERRVSVAYLGPEGTFSEQALIRQFGSAVESRPCASIDEVFRAVEAGTADFGLVPVENSSEGAVNRTLDLLLTSTVGINAEVSIPVQHSLMTRSGTLHGVTRVSAHSQALAQCQTWLNLHHPELERAAVASNAEAARMASQDPTVAAIAGEIAARRYGLHVVAGNIQDDPHNRTRFAVIGRLETLPSGRDQTSLILSVPNRAGAVYHMLAPLAKHGVSMTRFESRPARLGTWEYYFYVDVEGHRSDPKIAAALDELKRETAFFKILGSYPV